ncbi:MAG TPA: protein-glutamate O-methyltransferase CheR [Spirochaetia bacterium]|nr:protein-glutamate O-methyltransferase CheR [Spirochaetia bacterium]
MNAPSAPLPLVGGPVLAQETFDDFRALIHEKTGIHVREGKQILIANRLRKRLASLKLGSYEEYYELLTARRGEPEMANFIDAVSTNETYFFREGNHFSVLTASVLPELFKAHPRVRIWSAGCSTGEEVYTLRIVADQAARAAGAREPEIVGTDISTTVVTRAREGIYGERALRLVPPELLERYFEPAPDGAMRVNAQTRARVEFRVHNLFVDPPPWDAAHIIFCRNVMIYFDKPTQMKLVDGIFARALHPDGYLFIGHSESLSGFTREFTYASALKAPIYRRKQGGHRTRWHSGGLGTAARFAKEGTL